LPFLFILAKVLQYELPFQYINDVVKPSRDKERVKKTREQWWLFERPRPELRTAIEFLRRYIGTPVVSKYRIFVWLYHPTIPDAKVTVFAREDDYFFGILHSRIHEVWSLANGARHGIGNDPTYNTSTCFETFPFPWPPGQEPQDGPQMQAIAEAACELVQLRDAWLNPSGTSEAELKKRTLTNLYNQRPTWLDLAHKKLDQAVFATYGWPDGMSDDEILERLLALNLERSNKMQ
jgi:type II restriction/modification system DNA methylase subunit YeeA